MTKAKKSSGNTTNVTLKLDKNTNPEVKRILLQTLNNRNVRDIVILFTERQEEGDDLKTAGYGFTPSDPRDLSYLMAIGNKLIHDMISNLFGAPRG